MTPIQQAIEYWNDRMAEAGTAQLRQAAALFVHYLEALLPKEKEFVSEVWTKGLSRGYQDGKAGPNSSPTLPEFLNQLYPEK